MKNSRHSWKEPFVGWIFLMLCWCIQKSGGAIEITIDNGSSPGHISAFFVLAMGTMRDSRYRPYEGQLAFVASKI
jgi:hypothetical protein